MTSTVKKSDVDSATFPKLARERFTIASEVVELLRWRIIDGSLPPGTRLREERLSKEMGISRGPVREAVRELEQEGLIAVEPYRGAVVMGISESELRRVLIPLRALLEKAAVEFALELMTEDDFKVLEGVIKEMRAVGESGSPTTLRQLVELDVSFHRHIVESSGGYHTKQLWRVIQPRIRMGFYHLGSRHYHSSEIADEHEVLLSALRSRDLTIALDALDLHTVASPFELLDRGAAKQSEELQ
jgi:DNA-binding GntR family transcriptional regulator